MRTYKEGVETETSGVGGKGQHHEVDLPVLNNHDQAVKDTHVSRVAIGLTNILSHAQLSDQEFLLSKSAAVGGQVGKDESRAHSNEHGGSTFDVEQPSPSPVTQHALHVGQDTGADERRESVGDEVTAEEDGVALGQLTTGVPLAENQERSGQESGFDETKQETDGNHATKALDQASQG